MTNILYVSSSPRGLASESTKIADALVAKLVRSHPGATVVRRDLGKNPPQHIDENFVAGIFSPEDKRTEAQQAAVARSDAYVKDLFAADIIVVASAMINFGLSSTLKTWFDHIVRAHITFSYGEGGPKGLVTGKKAYLVEARGGVYSQGPMVPYDFQEPYLKHMLGFIGITDVETVRAEGLNLGPDAAQKSIADANAAVESLAA